MKKKKWLFMLVTVAMLLSLIPITAFADETSTSRTIDFATFLEEVANSNYNYDGKGVVVQWSPSSACTDTRPGHSCLFDENAPNADGNNPQRGQAPNAQYHIFNGQENVKIENVNFKFTPADFTLCLNSAWRGSFLKEDLKNAELQMQNTGEVYFSGCSFDRVIASPYSSSAKSTFIDCSFSNIYNAYAIKDIYSPNASIISCTFENCGGGIYFEGSAAKKDIVIQNNVFTNIDTNAAENKEFTRGLIQFSANGDYSASNITISGNLSTGEAATLRQLNKTVTADVLDLDDITENNKFSGNILTSSSFGTNTVYYNGTYYPTLAEALKGLYMSSPQSTGKIYCKPNADVGILTHGHVADDIIIYGNGAKISGGEGDLEIDTYKYDRETGVQSNSGTYLDKDITVKIFDLEGVAAWGQRNTACTVNLFFENCKNMDRIYFTNGNNQEGKIHVSLNNCSFDAANGSNENTAVYSNASGDIKIRNTIFKNISVGLNINHKSTGIQNITLEDCIFEDCALSDSPQAVNTKTYAAPIRIVAKEGATTNLSLKNIEFKYSEGKVNCGNGDVLIGDGRFDAAENQGNVTLAMNDTKANVVVQEKGYYTTADGSATDDTKAQTTAVSKSDVVSPDEDDHFIIDKHDSFKTVGAKDATCTAEGYTGDKVCQVCNKLIEKGEVIPKLDHIIKLQGVKESTCTAEGYTGDKVCQVCGKIVEKGTPIDKLSHTYKGGKCTVCGAVDPEITETDSPKTGDKNNLLLWVALLLTTSCCTLIIIAYSKKKKYNR